MHSALYLPNAIAQLLPPYLNPDTIWLLSQIHLQLATWHCFQQWAIGYHEHVPIVEAFGGAITCGGPLLGSDEPTPKPCHEHNVPTRVTPCTCWGQPRPSFWHFRYGCWVYLHFSFLYVFVLFCSLCTVNDVAMVMIDGHNSWHVLFCNGSLVDHLS